MYTTTLKGSDAFQHSLNSGYNVIPLIDPIVFEWA